MFSFLPMLAQKSFPAISMRHCFSTAFPRAVKSIITRTERHSAPGLSSSAPTQHFLSLSLPPSLSISVLRRELGSSGLLLGFAASFWVEQLMSSLGLHWPPWGMAFPCLRREQLRHFNLWAHLEPDECSAALETMCN